jgi:large subunit ribosomal protein L9
MPIELILMDNVENLGEIGDAVRVADGYARNYLVPKGLARKATPGALRQLEAKKVTLRIEYEKEVAGAQSLAEAIAKHSVSIPVQASDDEKLFGSVTAQNVADALKDVEIEMDPKNVLLEEPIKMLGVYPVDLRLHSEVTATLKVWVVRA